MTIVNNNYRERCGQTILAHGVIISSICTLKAAMAKTAIRTSLLGAAALAVSGATVNATQACFEPDTVDVNSFFNNFCSPFKESAVVISDLAANCIKEIDYQEKIDRIINCVHDFLSTFNKE